MWLVYDTVVLLFILIIILILLLRYEDDVRYMYGDRHNIVEIVLADEENNINEYMERSIYVTNLGITLSQTKDGISSLRLLNYNRVLVKYKDDREDCIYIKGKDYISITLEIVNKLYNKN